MKAYIGYWNGGHFTISTSSLEGSKEVELDGPEYTRLHNAQKQADKLQKELASMFYGRPVR